MSRNDQSNLSEHLQLLYELGYSDLDVPYQTSGVHSNKRSQGLDINHDIHFLDTLAIALTTGEPGDVFTAALDKNKHVQLVLAKNGHPTSEDVAAANKLISLLESPTITDVYDLFPFLYRRCGTNINKQIHSLHMSIQNTELHNDFRLALQTYVPLSDIHAEFPGAETILEMYGDAIPPFTIVLEDLVEMITNETVHGLDADNVSSSESTYAYLVILADALACSRFLKMLVNDSNFVNKDRKERVEKLKRRLGKVCQYLTSITYLIPKAKRMFPIPHRWVMDTFPGTGEGDFDLCDNAYDAVSRGLDQLSLSPDTLDKLDKHFPFIVSNWAKHKTVHACVHAEIRIILHLGISPNDHSIHPIGVGKCSCLCCVLWIESHNRIFGTRWMTNRSHSKPYANWALPGAACPHAIEADGKSSIDEAVLEDVGIQLVDTLDSLFLGQKRILDESSDEEERSKRKENLAAMAGLCRGSSSAR